jgi:hypothetical protein
MTKELSIFKIVKRENLSDYKNMSTDTDNEKSN